MRFRVRVEVKWFVRPLGPGAPRGAQGPARGNMRFRADSKEYWV